MQGVAMSAVGEFDGADFGDGRLSRRLVRLAEAIGEGPEQPFPKLFGTSAELEAFYRFVGNEKVTPEGILQPHIDATVGRAAAQHTIIVAHDTTEFRFEGECRQGLGRLGSKGQGFLGHFSLVLSADNRHDALGIVALKVWARTSPTATELLKKNQISRAESRRMERESARWAEQVEEVEETLDGTASAIHVMDSEADDYALMSHLVGAGRRFVLRLCKDRRVVQEEGEPSKLKDKLKTVEGTCQRTVKLSRRGRQPASTSQKRLQPREERTVELSFSAHRVTFERPKGRPDLPAQLEASVVSVREVNPPEGQEAVEWMLVTTEPIHSPEQVMAVVDTYRARWVIEEYFKALKTGCAYDLRQLESETTLVNALAIFIPIAWGLLRLRSGARDQGGQDAGRVLTATQIDVLKRISKVALSETPTLREALMAVAQLGGHIRKNGEPGWQVLGRGYIELLSMERGFLLAQRGQP